jgi:hypothetical protein
MAEIKSEDTPLLTISSRAIPSLKLVRNSFFFAGRVPAQSLSRERERFRKRNRVFAWYAKKRARGGKGGTNERGKGKRE